MIDPILLKRITVRPEVFGGKPIIRDMRISVELILSLLAQGVLQKVLWRTTLILNQPIFAPALPMHTR
jgi:uncharacterized protein (DUF433 family)